MEDDLSGQTAFHQLKTHLEFLVGNSVSYDRRDVQAGQCESRRQTRLLPVQGPLPAKVPDHALF
jgi:hypothetical protein